MSSGERPIGAAKGKQSDAEALCQPPPGYTLWRGGRHVGGTKYVYIKAVRTVCAFNDDCFMSAVPWQPVICLPPEGGRGYPDKKGAVSRRAGCRTTSTSGHGRGQGSS